MTNPSDPTSSAVPSATPRRRLTMKVNGREEAVEVADADLLVDVLRAKLRLTGTRVGCYNGDCGACTLRVDGKIAKSCLLLAAGQDGAEVTTIEGFSGSEELTDLQQALWENDAFQCGFCIAGHVFALDDLLSRNEDPTEAEVRDALIGNICRCTGYVNLVAAAMDVARRRRAAHEPRAETGAGDA